MFPLKIKQHETVTVFCLKVILKPGYEKLAKILLGNGCAEMMNPRNTQENSSERSRNQVLLKRGKQKQFSTYQSRKRLARY